MFILTLYECPYYYYYNPKGEHQAHFQDVTVFQFKVHNKTQYCTFDKHNCEA